MPSGTTEARLRLLGDPSGQQSAEYWNEWFDAVCYADVEVKDVNGDGERQSFEWYCDGHEISRVIERLKETLLERTDDEHIKKVIHPGSGNSFVPLVLAEYFQPATSKHVVVDISDVALEKVQAFHVSEMESNDFHAELEYAVANILQPPLPYPSGSFDIWLDKGLLDALFSGKDPVQDSIQSKTMFGEANRILCDGGMALIISLGESHSLKLVVENWKEDKTWSKELEIFELVPTSGEMLPFAFVLRKSADASCSSGDNAINSTREIVLHKLNSTSNFQMEYSRSLDSMVEEIDTILDVSREAFKTAGDRGLRKSKEASFKRLVLAKIEVKPSHDEVDLVTLTERITSNTWTLADKTFSPKWQQAKPLDPSQLLYGKIVPIGYGICKIILDCIIDSEELDGLCDSIIELLGEDNEDCVQSVDVDWKNVFPIGDAKDILQIKG
eukprot:scaffold48654_cov51-Attheya_sp.AAC.4